MQSQLFPLHTQAGRRYLIAFSGDPFLLQGDAAWSMIARLKREEIVQYLDERKALGFNTVLVSLIEHKFTDTPPNNAYGEPPFLTAGDFTTPNEKYFQHAEYAVSEAEKRGILVLLAPAYMGFNGGDEGWYSQMTAQGATRLKQYGRYVGEYFRNRKNILWVHGGDFNPPEGQLFRAVAEGIAEAEPEALHTFHGARNSSALGFISPPDTWLTVNNVYTSSDNVISSAMTEYARSTMPFFLIEAIYEGNGGFDSDGVRREAYQAVFSGAVGHVMGHEQVWQFAPGWQNALNTGAARSVAPLQSLMTQLHWPALQPDTQTTLVVEGRGSGAEQVAVSFSTDRTMAAVYVPTRRDITVDLSLFSTAQVRLQWFIPASGEFADLPGSPVTRSTAQVVSPPDNTTRDWVAIIESVR